MSELILNLTNINPGKIELTPEQDKVLRSKQLKVGSFLSLEGVLDSNYNYKITGASSSSGTPLRRYSLNYNAFKERIPKRKKAIRVLGATITDSTKVLDLKLSPKKENL